LRRSELAALAGITPMSARRILLRDLLTYREQRRAARYAALEATAVDIDDEEDLDTVLERLRETRHAVAKRRRRSSAP
jgi:hypothetical protein